MAIWRRSHRRSCPTRWSCVYWIHSRCSVLWEHHGCGVRENLPPQALHRGSRSAKGRRDVRQGIPRSGGRPGVCIGRDTAGVRIIRHAITPSRVTGRGHPDAAHVRDATRNEGQSREGEVEAERLQILLVFRPTWNEHTHAGVNTGVCATGQISPNRQSTIRSIEMDHLSE